MNPFQNISMKIRQFMEGRNGPDALCGFWFVLYMVSNFALRFTRAWWLVAIQLFFLAMAIWRMLSKNVDKRRDENGRFMELWSSAKNRLSGAKGDMSDAQYRRASRRTEENDKREQRRREREEKKKYKVFSCPECGQQLRVPRGRGNIIITCKKCGKEFEKKT